MEITMGGGPKGGNFWGGVGWSLNVFFPGVPIKIGELLKTNSSFVKQAFS